MNLKANRHRLGVVATCLESPYFGRLGQKDHKFESCLSNLVRPYLKKKRERQGMGLILNAEEGEK